MKIVYDNIIFSLQKNGGGTVYWSELLTHNLNEITKQLTYIDRKKNPVYLRYRFTNIRRRLIPIVRYLNPFVISKEYFIFHSSFFRVACSRKAINITTVHDFIYEYYRKDLKSIFHKWQKKYAVMHSSGVICISENTMKDFKYFYPHYNKEVKVIYNGISSDYYQIPNIQKKKQVLFVGARNEYKNFPYAIDILTRFPEYTFILIGGGALTAHEKYLLDTRLSGRYLKMDFVSNQELNILYNESFYLLYTSLYEGFGLPVVEAQAAGCPVVCCNVSSLPEVTNQHAVLISGSDIDKDIEKITLLNDTKYYNDLILNGITNSKKYSWDKCAHETLAFYKKIFEKDKGSD